MKSFILATLLSAAISAGTAIIISKNNSKPQEKVTTTQNLKAIEGEKVRLLNSSIGGFFFAVNGKEKVEKGYKFDFALGNRNYAKFEGVKMRISWGKKPEKKGDKPKLTSTNVGLDKIEIGEWKNFGLVIPATDEKDLEILALSILGAKSVSLIDSEK